MFFIVKIVSLFNEVVVWGSKDSMALAFNHRDMLWDFRTGQMDINITDKDQCQSFH